MASAVRRASAGSALSRRGSSDCPASDKGTETKEISHHSESAIWWAAARVMLFPLAAPPVDAAPDVSGLPLMRVDVDVDEGAHEAAPAGWPAVQPTTSFEGGV